MIYIIGGLPRTGKTLVGSILIKQMGCFGIDTDHLRALFKGDAASKIAFGKNDYAQATTALEPYIETFLEYQQLEKRDFVLCGEALNPLTLAKFKDSCKILFLGFSDVERQLKRVRANQHINDWVKELDDERLRRIFTSFSVRSRQLKDICAKCDIQYLDMSAGEFVSQLQTAIGALTGRVPTTEYLKSAVMAHMRY